MDRFREGILDCLFVKLLFWHGLVFVCLFLSLSLICLSTFLQRGFGKRHTNLHHHHHSMTIIIVIVITINIKSLKSTALKQSNLAGGESLLNAPLGIVRAILLA